MHVFWFVRWNFLSSYSSTASEPSSVSLCRMVMRSASTTRHDAGVLRRRHRARVDRHAVLDAGTDERRLGLDERDGLALHVRAHQRPVRVVVLEERDERGGRGDELLRRDVHELDLLARHRREVVLVSRQKRLLR